MFASTIPMSSAPILPVNGSGLASPPSYDAIALNPNGPRSRTNLFVRKLASAVMEQDLKALFVPFGDILSFALMRDIHTGESLGTAFVRFATHEQAKTAMAALDEKPLYGRPISIQWAKRQHDSTPVGEARAKIRKLFVRNIPLDVTTRRLRQLFSPFGTIANVTVHADTAPPTHPSHMPPHSDPNTGMRVESFQEMPEVNQEMSGQDEEGEGAGGSGAPDAVRNIAFVVFNEDGAASAAVEALHNTSPFSRCDGVPLMVKLAEDNRQRLERRMRFQDGSEANAHQVSSSPSSPAPLHMLHLPNGANAVTAVPFMGGAPVLLPSGQAPMLQKGHVTGFPTAASAANTSPAAGGQPGAFMINPASQASSFTASNGAMPGQYVLVAAPPGSGAASPTYWLQPMPSPTGASVSPQSRSSTPSMVYAGGAQTTPPQPGTPAQSMRASPNFFVPMPTNAFNNTSYRPAASSPNASGSASGYIVNQSAAQSPRYGGGGGGGGLPMMLPLANGAMPGSSMHSHPSQFSITPESMSPRSDLSPRMGLSGRYAHPLSQSQPQQQPWQAAAGAMPPSQHMSGSNGFGPIRSPNSPVRGTPITPGHSSSASRTGLSLPHAPLADSYDGVAGGSVANSSQFLPSFSAAAMPTMMKPVPMMNSLVGRSFDYGNGISLSSVRPRRVVDASGDQDVALTDVDPDTTYGSMRLENSANLIAPHFLDGLTGGDDERDADERLADEGDMTDEQLLELARNMALLEDDDCVNHYAQTTGTR